jgi:hypothetical protein
MEQGTKNLLIVSSIIALGGLGFFLFDKRNKKALNIYSVGKSTNGNLYLFFTTKSPQAINKFIQNSNPNQAIQELSLEKNPNKSDINTGSYVEVKGLGDLDGSYPILRVLTPSSYPNRVMAIKVDKTNMPSGYTNITNGNKDRFYAQNSSNVGKLIIK